MRGQVGKTVDGWCTKCKLVLAHTIEAVADGKITRVHCNTCGGQHAHRASAPGTSKAKAGGAKAAGRATADKAKRPSPYESLVRGRTAAASKPYVTSARFAVGELISHTSFGLGVVTAERDGVKIEVMFPDGPRVLMHGYR